VYLPVTMEIIRGTLRVVDPGELGCGYTGIQCVRPIRVSPGQVSPLLFVSVLPLQCGFCRNSTWVWGSKGALHTPALLASLWKPGEGVVTRAPEYFWCVSDLCLLQ